ncbi:hypothetical protein Tco_0802175 [Tanacetum coccineum]|uniref:Uncharacterized protein n=1 Tax=Tanacetum coccineum TaxID=301880 RepID=A0ABQ4ZYX1_9ASTR
MRMRNNKHLQHLPIPLIPFISTPAAKDEFRKRDAVEIEDEDEEDEKGGDSDEEKVCEDEVFNGGAFAGFAVFRRGGGGEEGAALE